MDTHELMTIEKLKYAPDTRMQLIKFMQLVYEEYASIITDEELVNEYNILRRENKLYLLAEAEIQSSEKRMRDQQDEGL